MQILMKTKLKYARTMSERQQFDSSLVTMKGAYWEITKFLDDQQCVYGNIRTENFLFSNSYYIIIFLVLKRTFNPVHK